MSCSVCGAAEDTDIHALFECPLAFSIWEGTPFVSLVESCPFNTVWSMFFHAKEAQEDEQWAKFITVA